MFTPREDQNPVSMLDRIASLLEAFGSRDTLTLAEICRYSNVPRSTAHRLLQGLVQIGWIERQGVEYALGLRMFELGSQAVRQRRVTDVARPLMADLHRRTGLTVHVSILSGAHVLHVERVGVGPTPGRCWQVGSKQAVEQAAAGRALLSDLDEADWPELDYATTSSYGIRNRADLDRDLVRVRARGGVAVDAEGCVRGVTVVAAPIGARQGGQRFALSLSGSSRTMRVDPVIAAVNSAAWEVWHALSGIPNHGAMTMRAAHRAVTPAMVHRAVDHTSTAYAESR